MKFIQKATIFFILLLTLFCTISCHTYYHPTQAKYQRYRFNSESDTLTAPGIKNLIAPYKSEVSSQMNEVIARVPEPLDKKRPESTLGNWMADAINKYVEINTGEKMDLSICNYGGVRLSEIPKGDLTVGTIYELMPFDNYVVTMNVSGTILLKILDRIAEYGGWPVSSGLDLTIRNKKIADVKLNSQPILPEKSYSIALSDYLANGGDNLYFLRSLPRTNLNIYYRDALIDIARQEKVVIAQLEGRIKTIDHDQ